MQRIFISAVAALALVSPVRADGFSTEQAITIRLVAKVAFAGADRHCPRLKAIDRAIVDELLSAGIAPDHQLGLVEQALSTSVAQARIDYSLNPEAFCAEARSLAGPHGRHGRQMLEASN